MRHGLAAAAVTLALLGCSSDGDAPAATTSRPEARPTTSTTTTTTPPADAALPEVLDPGAAPRRPLRLAYAEGATATLRVTSDSDVDRLGDDGTATARVDAPAVTSTVRYEVTAVDDGTATVAMEVTAVDVPEGTPDAARSATRWLVGLTGTARISPLGEADDVAFQPGDGVDVPAGAEATLAAAADQFAALGPTLPVEPVGVGAAWRWTTVDRSGPIPVEVEATTTLVGVDGGEVTYRTDLRGTPDAAPVDAGDGTTVAAVDGKLTGRASGTVRLDRPWARTRATVRGPITFAVTRDGTTTEQRQELRQATAVRPATG